jgi:predicted HicB family RNase H-like nuclease
VAKSRGKQIVVTVSDTLHRKAKIKAAKTGKPMAQVMREALEEWTADEPDPN